ncbi:sulfite exporter TauE/SafE family protein [Methanoregula sp.]|uniref:sulfite exporter TauE/SafE family protein n=1 Tax=Methanoregula sp. TaxID=2052170 RepID=UPI0035650E57
MESLIQVACLFLTGIVAGTVSGLFGVGGGALMTPVQYWLYTASGMDSTLATRLAFGTSLAVIIPTMISGALGHHRHGAVDWKAAVPMGCAAIFGGIAGGMAASHIPGSILRLFFAVFILIMAVRMVWHIRGCPACEPRGSAVQYIFIGFSIGILSGLTGLGGGALLVPILVILLGYPIHRAVGTSSACLIFSAAGAVIAYIINGIGVAGLPPYSAGYVDLLTFAILAVTTIPLARLGVRFAHSCSGRNLQVIFAGLLALIGVLMLASG